MMELKNFIFYKVQHCWKMPFFFLRFYLFLGRGEEKEKEEERTINVWLLLMHPILGTWPATQACALSGNQTGNPLVCRLALSLPSHASQGGAEKFLLPSDPMVIAS